MFQFQDKTVDVICTLKSNSSDLHVDIDAWLAGNPLGSFQAWKQRMPTKRESINICLMLFSSAACS